MTTTTSHPDPADTHVGYIIRMLSLTYAVDIELLETRPTCRDINDMEIRDFSTSMIDISHRASTFYTNLRTRMDPADAAKLLDDNNALHKAMQNIQRDSCLVKLGTTEMAKCNYANLTLDHEYLLEEIMEHEDYLSAEDHVIIQGMKQREEWKEMMNKIAESSCT